MPETSELLAQVLANPAADEPRLEYAKYCDEQGDPRGEFIRLQMEVFRIRRADGTAAEWGPPAQAAQRLWAQGRYLWLRPLKPWLDDGRVSEPTFHRGFVEHVTGDARVLIDVADELYAAAPIRHLSITGAAGAGAMLFGSPALERIASLTLAGNQLSDDDVRALAASARLGRLVRLDLSRTGLGVEALEALAASHNLPRLECLWWVGNPVDDPADRVYLQDGEPIAAEPTELGQDLEARFGALPWLHGPSRWPRNWPPTCDAF